MRLAGKTALVTGASSGVGRAIAIAYAEQGATVVCSDITANPLWDDGNYQSTADVISERGGRATFVGADISDSDAVDELVAQAGEVSGRLDVLVNSAAIFRTVEIIETSNEDWDATIAVNLSGCFYACRAAIRLFLGQELINEVRGRIVNISSQHGMIGPPMDCAYGVSKGGVVQLTRQLSVDYARRGVIVNAVAPGRIITGTHPGEPEYLASGAVDDDIKYSLSRTPYPRLGRPEDVAGAAVYLASDECSYVSGHNLLVDGGWMAY